ncbi:hypothetical protein BDZ90DRAFT_276956 [Jaminaea rosea]|uniref:Uncharacterized protein n=1 Tax=Jaminaea rosea TaxID=1569628 RepID=A0A316UZT8_9BASI|nr:hypothetical protein BDZ90DRAFT_276956 [Jaminaea rosea]PWN30494.1 hypothetical protein BDZ90DRAFT_276956 [Jaminaea rosea]
MRPSTSSLSNAPWNPARASGSKTPAQKATRASKPEQGQASVAERAVQQGQNVRGGNKKTLWQSWMSLPPRTRMTCGFALAAFSVLGIVASDKLEEAIPVKKSPAHPIPSTSAAA